MTFLTPLLAGIAAAIAVPTLVILYFLKLRRRDVEISTTLLWRKAIEDLQANAPFQRLRRNILLILQLLALAATLFALAQPQMKALSLAGNKYVILIDRSASMGSLDEDDGRGGKQTRLEAAKKQATVLVDSLAEASVFGTTFGSESSDEAMVIAFDSSAEVRQTFTSDKRALKAAIEAVTPSEGPTSLEEAMRLARAHAPKKIIEDVRTDADGNVIRTDYPIEGITGGPPLSIHLWSDGRIPDADRSRPNVDDTFEFHPVGSPKGYNVGITGLRAERSFDDPEKLSVFVAVENNEPLERTVDVELVVEGASARLKTITLPAAISALPVPASGADDAAKPAAPAGSVTPGTGGVVFQLDRAGGALVQVNLRNPGSSDPPAGDVLAVDNRAWVVAPAARRLAVLAVAATPDLYIDNVLSSLNLSRLTQATPAQFNDMLRQGKAAEYDVVVLSKSLPAQDIAGLSSFGLPPGRFLILGAVPTGNAASGGSVPAAAAATETPAGSGAVTAGAAQGSGLIDSGPVKSQAIIDWTRSHPALRDVSLDGIVAVEGRKMLLAEGSQAQVLATADTGPAIVELSSADTRAIVCAFDPSDSTWTFKDSYVIFMVGALKYLGQDVAFGGLSRSIQPGSVLSDRLPSNATDVEVESPDGTREDVTPAPDGRIVFGPLARTGVYRVSWKGAAGTADQGASGGAARYYAANLLDPVESETIAVSKLDLADREVIAKAKAPAEASKRLWPYFILIALAFMLVEWFIFNRKVHV